MPRLGTSDEATPNQSGSSMRTAMAYPNFRNTYLWKMLGIFLTFFLLRNLMFKDYKKEEVAYLRSIGKTEEEISQYFEETISKKSSPNDETTYDIKQLKLEIDRLKKDMKMLKAQLNIQTDGFDKGDNHNDNKNIEDTTKTRT